MFYFTFSFIFYVLDLERKYSTHTTYGNKKIHFFKSEKSLLLIQVMGSLLWFVKIYSVKRRTVFEAFLLYVITCIWANIEWYFRMGYGKIRQKLKRFLKTK